MVECCPICGKKPRLKIKVYGNHWGAEVVCKPIFVKEHLSTFALDENKVDAVHEAIKRWNSMVILRNEVVEKIENYAENLQNDHL
jgi:hypothetical protein